MQSLENFKKEAWREASQKVSAWKKESPEEYSRFSLDVPKVMHNDYSGLERIFKMAVSYVPLPVLLECQKLFSPGTSPEADISTSEVIDDIMDLQGYLRFGMSMEVFDDKGNLIESDDDDEPSREGTKTYLIREYGVSGEDRNDEDEDYIYLPFQNVEEYWESLPSVIQLITFNLGKGHTAAELATMLKRILIAASYYLPTVLQQLHEQILHEKNPLLMSTLYYIFFDHGIPKTTLALTKVGIGAKQINWMHEALKTVVEKLVATSVTEGLDRKLDWAEYKREVENDELETVINTTLANTTGKHGRPHLEQEVYNIEDWLVGDKSALKSEILVMLGEMEHDYELAYLWVALIRSGHLAEGTKFVKFFRVICDFANHDYQYDRGQRMATLIEFGSEEFETSRKSSLQRGRRWVNNWTERLTAIS